MPHHDTKDLTFEIIDFIDIPVPPESDTGTKIRRLKEKFWIHKLKTFRPYGINILE